MERHDVAVIGAGVVGAALARTLSLTRTSVVLIEAQSEAGFGTSKANSGIIHAGHHGDPATLKGALEWPGNQAWDALAAELGFAFRRIGELTVAFDDAERAHLDLLEARGRAKGVPGLERWDAERVRREEPALSHDVVEALYAPTAGVVNPYEACYTLVENAVRNGVEAHFDAPVTAVEALEDGGGFALQAGGRRIEARYVVNAAGLYGDALNALAGASGPRLRARKGEEYLLDKRLQGYVERLVFPAPSATSKGTLIIPTYDGTLMVGPTAHETDDKEDLTTTAEGAAEVFEKVRRLAPGLQPSDTIAQFAGLRAVAEDDDFHVGATDVPRWLQALGIQSPGLTAAPVLAERLVAALAEQGLALEPDPDAEPTLPPPVRFATAEPVVQEALVARDPAYATMVCRCEWVTEGEIRDAIARGARTLDGIKFRTRAGMGRCQGGFCRLRCMELLERDAGIALPDVRKHNPGSWVAIARVDGTPGREVTS